MNLVNMKAVRFRFMTMEYGVKELILQDLQERNLTRTTFTVLPSLTLTQGITFSSANPRSGDSVTTTFKLKNSSNQPIQPVNTLV